jgi:hypothetical protein
MNSPSWSIVGLRKTGAVSRMKSFQNWPGNFLGLGRRRQPHQPLFEALRLERAGERLLDDEDDPVATAAEDVADADAVVRRPEGALGEEDNRAHRPSGWRATKLPMIRGSGAARFQRGPRMPGKSSRVSNRRPATTMKTW